MTTTINTSFIFIRGIWCTWPSLDASATDATRTTLTNNDFYALPNVNVTPKNSVELSDEVNSCLYASRVELSNKSWLLAVVNGQQTENNRQTGIVHSAYDQATDAAPLGRQRPTQMARRLRTHIRATARREGGRGAAGLQMRRVRPGRIVRPGRGGEDAGRTGLAAHAWAPPPQDTIRPIPQRL
ncbi:hypothetical protein NEOLEDRAFT_314346 [Neolentinus lepideus HHB14362 ss-1]|uniref:Uncharacterized protein n=1 Tax=Neolentinus lepideus HHB14362 ss-1 TaxID=1314782 RepID=A0A165VTM6_9AGAM|nr:hypothetical protein NEOLEDRAFT_314346 [Neolentinus lepideus HHB14362 ss-1]